MKGKKYYRYAGYYEIYISAHKMKAPFVLLGWNRSLGAAVAAAGKDDPMAILIDDAFREEHEEMTPEWVLEEGKLMYGTFEGKDKYIENGLSEYTKYLLQEGKYTAIRTIDQRDIAEYLSARLRCPFAKAMARIRGKSYAELQPIVTAAR